MFASKHPELKANVYDLRKYEETFDVEDWVKKILESGEVISF